MGGKYQESSVRHAGLKRLSGTWRRFRGERARQPSLGIGSQVWPGHRFGAVSTQKILGAGVRL